MKTAFTQEEKYFLLRRLHSLTGIVPIGLFFLEHLYSNAKSLQGAAAFDAMVRDLMKIPYLPFIEIGAIALPILFHVVLGIAIILTSKNNIIRYSYFNNWRYFLQRMTGLIGIVYIAYHVYETRIHSVIEGEMITYREMQHLLMEPGMIWFYFVGVISLTFHFTNGIWTSLITWGVTVTERSQRLATYICMGLFVILSAAWIHILLNFVGWV